MMQQHQQQQEQLRQQIQLQEERMQQQQERMQQQHREQMQQQQAQMQQQMQIMQSLVQFNNNNNNRLSSNDDSISNRNISNNSISNNSNNSINSISNINNNNSNNNNSNNNNNNSNNSNNNNNNNNSYNNSNDNNSNNGDILNPSRKRPHREISLDLNIPFQDDFYDDNHDSDRLPDEPFPSLLDLSALNNNNISGINANPAESRSVTFANSALNIDHNTPLLAAFKKDTFYACYTVFDEAVRNFERTYHQRIYHTTSSRELKVYTCPKDGCSLKLSLSLQRTLGNLWRLIHVEPHTCESAFSLPRLTTRELTLELHNNYKVRIGADRDKDIMKDIEKKLNVRLGASMYKRAKGEILKTVREEISESYSKLHDYASMSDYAAYETDQKNQLRNAFFLAPLAREIMLHTIPIISVDATFASNYLLTTAAAVDYEKRRIPIAFGVTLMENTEYVFIILHY